MPNHLASETSPYLLQHKNNPVDWYPWGAEALERAKKEQKPIFLSIGYSACHWCHVMEHESFENEEIAKSLNEKFICIKVDREERPDLDQLYMNAVQRLTGRGGWPMSVFLTPDQKPFYAGTYWPPHAQRGMPGFDQVIASVSKAWEENRKEVVTMSDRLTADLAKLDQSEAAGEIDEELIVAAVVHFRKTFDRTHGGFGGAPKFPSPMILQLLLRHWHRKREQSSLDMVRITLDRMAAGGIYDHLGGGFARYSVDARWLVPHFEKMLYDNAQLVATYLEAFQATGHEDYARVVRETLDYTLRDMTDTAGGFYSTEDADSEGVEGKFYTWKPADLREVLGEEAAETFARVYDVTDAGNFEHTNILNLPKTLKQQAKLLGIELEELKKQLAESQAKLFAAREQRIHPHKDDKVLVAWNGLMIDAMARAGAVLAEPRYVEAAAKAADFLLEELRKTDGRLLHTWRHGQAKIDAYLDDYTYLANGLVSLYESTFEGRYLDEAVALVEVVLDKFSDNDGNGFYYTADDQEALIVRGKDFLDNAVPSGNAMAAMALVRLGKMTGRQNYLDAARSAMLAAADLMRRAPSATAQMLIAVDLRLGPTYEMVLAGDLADETSRTAVAELHRRYLPNKVLVFAAANQQGAAKPSEALADLLLGKSMLKDAPTLYVCEGFTCQAPAQGLEEITHALDELMPQGLFD
ncbi:MAG: thioredoxin domain-containing protein [Planctomycetes bacterium]|nr:thioredoxin domain-containing protein [Planctomycetota bacterium]